jgi:VanZ family protein
VWAGTIFFTSCFYISGVKWVQFVQKFLPFPAWKSGFEAFWNSYSLYVVKGWHVTEYAILFIFVSLALKTRATSLPLARLYSWLICLLFAMSDEWHQTFVPPRDGCVRDVFIDMAGASLVLLVQALYEHKHIEDKSLQD